MTLSSAYAIQESVEESTSFVKDFSRYFKQEEHVGGERDVPSSDLHDFLDAMKTLELNENDVTRLSDRCITSLAWHPNSSNLLLAAGDKKGSISKCSK